MICEATAYARAGLVGNPSDGYFGKTISFAMRDFSAKVTLYESPELEIVPSFQDRFKYASMREMREDVKVQGYYGGIRLMKATVCKFLDYCEKNRIRLHDRNFSIRYRSTIPQRVGLAGSSALVTATLRCLMEFYEVDIPKEIQPNLTLSVEQDELGIAAGLQDRVIQVYEGLVFMNFDRELLEGRGYGEYEELDPASLPNLFIAYRTDLAEGSEVFHNNIRDRWLAGDPAVVEAMHDFASYAQAVRDLLVAGRGNEIGPWMDRNFDRRRSIFQLDPKNVDMVMRARSVGASCKFAGSGGAVVGCYEDDAMYKKLEEVYAETGTVIFKPEIAL
ncbi:MAG TPA: GHMP kinase [Candidatus Hydrogenedentes bacterium]|nr:GHMP kinase [Candidatus Hydrogenedentota bacterium]HRT18783.1 GHMP kinase [Candidatus Hydrogenedentota bacterium]HRT65771.1 GHMP kinase [Candidatus Hydrogenedentota bacterium]